MAKMSRTAPVIIVGTLDTKGLEVLYIKECLEQVGQAALLLDAGVLGQAATLADLTREQVAEAGGSSLATLRSANERGKAVATMGLGASKLVSERYEAGQVAGVIGLGGSAGTSIAARVMQSLPVGLPKLIVSTMASGDTRPYIGSRDISMMHSVVDIAGLNRFSKEILANAAAAIAGMAQHYIKRQTSEADKVSKVLIAATMFGVTTPCVERARAYLEAQGYEVLVFHATGAGGQAMEALIDDGFIDGVLDVTTTEWADELVGGILSAGPTRLDAMSRADIPYVLAPGALDMVNFGPLTSVPEQFTERLFYEHNPQITLMRTTPEENQQLGQILAGKLNKSAGQTHIFLPLKGVSALDKEGQVFYQPDSNQHFNVSLKDALHADIPIHELNAHINDEVFALAMAETLHQLLQTQNPRS